MKQTGDYYFFANEKNMEKLMTFLFSQSSDYCMVSPVFFSLDEHVNEEKDVPLFKSMNITNTPEEREYLIKFMMEFNPGKYTRDQLKRRIHAFSFSLRLQDRSVDRMAVYNPRTGLFVNKYPDVDGKEISLIDHLGVDGPFEMFRNLVLNMQSSGKGILMPFESGAIQSGHMCMIYMHPAPRKYVAVHIYDPNGKIPNEESDLPFCPNYRKLVESAILVLFDHPELKSIVHGVSVQFRSIPNFNIPGSRPRTHSRLKLKNMSDAKIEKVLEKSYQGYKMDKILNVSYIHEWEGICAVVAFWIMVMLLCYGKRALNDDFWFGIYKQMSHKTVKEPIRTAGRTIEVNLHTLVFNGKEIVVQVYNRQMYMRAFASAIYNMAIHGSYNKSFGTSKWFIYDKTEAKVEEANTSSSLSKARRSRKSSRSTRHKKS